MPAATAPVRLLVRNRCIVRVLVAWLLFVVDEYATWTAVLVYAFERHGTTGAALAAFGQLLPAAVCAPWVATLADRRSPTWLLRAGFAVQITGLALGAVAMTGGAPEALACVGAVVAATAVVATRPAMALVVPGVARDAAELAAANAVVGWLECVGTILSGLLVGGVLAVTGPGWVLVASGLALVGAGAVVGRLRVLRIAAPEAVGDDDAGERLRDVVRAVATAPRLRVLLGVLTAGAVVIGALDVLFVVIASDVLGRGPAWAGYLTTAFGVGGVLAVGVTVVVVGRGRLGRPVVCAALVLVGALAATSTVSAPAPVFALVVLVGGAHAVLDVGGRALLQLSAPSTRTGRVFGLVEAATMAGMAAGALLVPALAAVGGPAAALLGIAAAGPLALLLGGPAFRHLDHDRPEPLVELSLLRQSPAFAGTTGARLRELATTAERVQVAPGAAVPAGVLVAGGVVTEPAGGGHAVTRRRGELVGSGAVARTAVTAYRLTPSRADPSAAVTRFSSTGRPVTTPALTRPRAAATPAGSDGNPPPPTPR